MNNLDIFTHKFFLPYSAMTVGGRVKMDWLLNIFQDAASTQCHTMGVSGFDMAEKQLKWVVVQYRIRIHQPFDWMTPLVLKTWRSPFKNLYEVRQFTLHGQDKNGRENEALLVSATSIWILIKAANNRPVRLTPNMPAALMQCESEPVELFKPKQGLDRIDHECRFPVHFLDLDLNEHVNNRVYIRWAVESLPGTLNFEYNPVACDVVYQKEALAGDSIQSQVSMEFSGNTLTTNHAIKRPASGDKLAHLILTWKKNAQGSIFQYSHDL